VSSAARIDTDAEMFATFHHRRSVGTLAGGLGEATLLQICAAVLILELPWVWCPRFSVFGGAIHPEGWTPNTANPPK